MRYWVEALRHFKEKIKKLKLAFVQKFALLCIALLLNLSLFSAIIHYLASWNIIFTYRVCTHLFLVLSLSVYLYIYFKALLFCYTFVSFDLWTFLFAAEWKNGKPPTVKTVSREIKCANFQLFNLKTQRMFLMYCSF